MNEPGQDLVVRAGVVIPAAELLERFSRASGPGGQGVNTTDSRVELVFDPAASAAFTPTQRERVVQAMGPAPLRFVGAEHRSQRRNREAVRDRLAEALRDALAPGPGPRRATRPTRGSQTRRLDAKRRRSDVKSGRGRITPSD